MADKTSPIDLESKIQLVLMDLEEQLLKEKMPCGFYRRGDWRPNEWSRRILGDIAEWGEEICTEHSVPGYDKPRRKCYECWQLLLEKEG